MAMVDGEPGPGEPPGLVAADPDLAEPAPVTDAGPADTPDAVPPGLSDPTAVAEGEGGSVPADATEALPVPHEPAEADGGHHAPDADTVTTDVPDEPGTAPAAPGMVDQDGVGPEGATRAEAGSGPRQGRGRRPRDPGRPRLRPRPAPGHPAQRRPGSVRADRPRPRLAPRRPGRIRSRPVPRRSGRPRPGPDRAGGAGSPGSTAASLWSDRDGRQGRRPLRAPHGRAGPGPGRGRLGLGAAGSFEEQDPVDPPAGASDWWREAKLAAERDRSPARRPPSPRSAPWSGPVVAWSAWSAAARNTPTRTRSPPPTARRQNAPAVPASASTRRTSLHR